LQGQLNNFPPDVFSVAEQPCHEQVSVSFKAGGGGSGSIFRFRKKGECQENEGPHPKIVHFLFVF
jgi:hypothetical protein